MKIAPRIVGLVGIVGATWLGLSLTSGDPVTSNYVTLQEARADHLFERGWLPDILPASAHEIRTINNLDLNTSTGRFSFAAKDYVAFSGRLAPYAPIATPFEGFGREIEQKRARGFTAGIFTEANAVWVFMCKPEMLFCEYHMWVKKG